MMTETGTGKSVLQENIDHFNFDIIDEYKRVTIDVQNDSRFGSIFKKKNYDATIRQFTKVKTDALMIDVENIPTEDEGGEEIRNRFEKVLYKFNALCDAQIYFQTLMKKKAQKDGKIKMSECKIAARKINEKTALLQDATSNLDVIYADYLEGEDE